MLIAHLTVKWIGVILTVKLGTGITDIINHERQDSLFRRRFKNLYKDRYALLLLFPVLLHLFIFCYIPIYGISISFRDFQMGDSFFALGQDANWVGFKHFIDFFQSMYFVRVMRNTVLNSVLTLLIGFWIPIIFALLLNEVVHKKFKKVVQSVSSLPYFISSVVIVGIVISFVNKDGLINNIIELLGGQRVQLLNEPQYFRIIYILMHIWQHFGWSAVLYLAAISSVSPALYESADIDGANRWQKMWNITLPGIVPTIVVMLILAIGTLLNSDTERILLLYNPLIYETADVIGTYIYRIGLIKCEYSYSAAVGLFTNAVNLVLVILANKISNRVSNYSLW